MMTRTELIVASMLSFGLAACGEDDAKKSDSQDATATFDGSDTTPHIEDMDTGAGTAETAETNDAPDTAEVTDAADTHDSADTAEVTPPCVPASDVFEDPRYFECGGVLTRAFYWEDFSETQCPAYYTHDDKRYDSVEALAAALNCDANCEYRATRAVDLIGCVSGHRTGYEVYEADGEGCLDAVYGTPKGPMRDLCDWEEKACRADCNPDCQEGVVGAVNASQLSGAAGTLMVTDDLDQGQSFKVTKSGIVTGVELRAFRCDTKMPASLTLFDADGVELGYAEVPNTTLPAGCGDTGALAADTTGPTYFALETTCVGVTAGATLRFRVSRPACDATPCPDGPSVGYDVGTSYGDGTAYADDEPVSGSDLSFKVFVK